jgi:metal-responsive CopG/Arc/MetJ family transcriptional regulator
MKTDISIPNPLFRSAQRLAEKLGISLSDLYAAAVSDYVLSHEKESVTEALNQVYENEPSELEPELVNIQLASIGSNAW